MARTTIRSEDIADGEILVADVADDSITNAKIKSDAAIAATKLAGTLDLSSKTVTLPAASVTAHVTAFDDVPMRRDIATLALHTAISDNKAAYNLSNAFIDQFEDDTGLDTETTCNRSDAEYMAAVIPGPANDSSTMLLIHSDTSNGSTTFVDSSAASPTHVVDAVLDNTQHSTSQKKFGASGIYIDGVGSEGIRFPAHANWGFGTGDFTIDCWFYPIASQSQHAAVWGTTNQAAWTSDAWFCGYSDHASRLGLHMGGGASYSTNQLSSGSAVSEAWHHGAWTKDSGEFRIYLDGVQVANNTQSVSLGSSGFKVTVGSHEPNGSSPFKGYLDEFRVSSVCRYPDGTSFTPEVLPYGGSEVNATGNYTSATQTALASVSTMGIVVLYKDNAGTATLNTDIIAQVSANGGTNYANATLVAGGTFSTGIKIAAVSGVSVTAGTTPKYKISFANQALASKETQVHGVALLY